MMYELVYNRTNVNSPDQNQTNSKYPHSTPPIYGYTSRTLLINLNNITSIFLSNTDDLVKARNGGHGRAQGTKMTMRYAK